MAYTESSMVREAMDIGPPRRSQIYVRTTVTATEIFQLPSTIETGGNNGAKFWTFQAVTQAVFIQFAPTNTITTIVTADRSGLTGTTLTADVNNGYIIPAGQERTFRIPAGWFVGHISNAATGALYFYESSGDGDA